MRSFAVKNAAKTRDPKGRATLRSGQRIHDLRLQFHEELKAAGYRKADAWELAGAIASIDDHDAVLERALAEAKARIANPAAATNGTAAEPSRRNDIASKVALILADFETAHSCVLDIVAASFDPKTRTCELRISASAIVPRNPDGE